MKKYVYLSALLLVGSQALAAGMVGVALREVEGALADQAMKGVIEKAEEGKESELLKSMVEDLGFQDPMDLLGAQISSEQWAKLSSAEQDLMARMVHHVQRQGLPTVSKVSLFGNSSTTAAPAQGVTSATAMPVQGAKSDSANGAAVDAFVNQYKTYLAEGKIEPVDAQNTLRAVSQFPQHVGEGNIKDCATMTATQIGNEGHLFQAGAVKDGRQAFKLAAAQMVKDKLATNLADGLTKMQQLEMKCHLTNFLGGAQYAN